MQSNTGEDKIHHTLSAWLGLPHSPLEVDPILSQKLSHLGPKRPDVEIFNEKLEKNWQQIEFQLEHTSLPFGTLNIWLRVAAKRIFRALSSLPSVVGAAVVLCLLVIGHYKFSASDIWLHLDSTAATVKKINLSTMGFSNDDKSLVRGHFEYTELGMRGIKDLRAKKDADGIELQFTQGTLFVLYKPSSLRPQLKIRTPNAYYQVVGTRFLIHSEGKSEALFVSEGTVKTSIHDVQKNITVGQSWTANNPHEIHSDVRQVSAAFENFLSHEARDMSFFSERAAKSDLLATIYLNDGNILRGYLLSDAFDFIEVGVPFKERKLKVKKSDISHMEAFNR